MRFAGSISMRDDVVTLDQILKSEPCQHQGNGVSERSDDETWSPIDEGPCLPQDSCGLMKIVGQVKPKRGRHSSLLARFIEELLDKLPALWFPSQDGRRGSTPAASTRSKIPWNLWRRSSCAAQMAS